MISSFEVVSFIVTLEALSSNIVIDASRVVSYVVWSCGKFWIKFVRLYISLES